MVEQTSKRRNVVDTRPQLSSQALRRYKKSMDLGDRIAQLKRSARIDAEKDPRNSFAMAAMIEALCKHLSPNPYSSCTFSMPEMKVGVLYPQHFFVLKSAQAPQV